ncbi:hypothetical protein, partial [Enterococcus faecium]|uniref:hypothetical protein n=1 Tax=Enterococcus faecium TaxID=1352 RepID=UPI003CC65F5A
IIQRDYIINIVSCKIINDDMGMWCTLCPSYTYQTNKKYIVFLGGHFKLAKVKFDSSKPHVNIGTIGHVDHG